MCISNILKLFNFSGASFRIIFDGNMQNFSIFQDHEETERISDFEDDGDDSCDTPHHVRIASKAEAEMVRLTYCCDLITII